jgi:molybdate-binding protein/DNA-binding XRE family transcriptional regulator
MTLRQHRETAGLSQQALAAQVGLSRQAYGAIESGRATPGVDVALALARTLSTTVEALFASGPPAPLAAVALAELTPGARVTLARVSDRVVAVPIPATTPTCAADGRCHDGGAAGATVLVELFSDDAVARSATRVVVAGCALGLGVIADRLNASGAGRFVWWPTSNAGAHALLSQGLVHLASSHQQDADGVDPGVTLGRWELGCATRPDDTRVRHADDLRSPALRLVHREAGAGAEQLLRRLTADAPTGQGPIVTGHLDVARAVAFGAADVGICARDAATSLGLRFVPVQEERVVVQCRPGPTDERVARFLDAVTSRAVRRELDALGYDTRDSGVGTAA